MQKRATKRDGCLCSACWLLFRLALLLDHVSDLQILHLNLSFSLARGLPIDILTGLSFDDESGVVD